MHSRPRSTSGMAVSIASELVMLPSSPSLRSTLYRGSRWSNGSLSLVFPTGFEPAVVLAMVVVVVGSLSMPMLVPTSTSSVTARMRQDTSSVKVFADKAVARLPLMGFFWV